MGPRAANAEYNYMKDAPESVVTVGPEWVNDPDSERDNVLLDEFSPSAEGRVLIVESNPSDAFLIGQMLLWIKLERYEFVHAKDLFDACGELTRRRFDCVLLDLDLPDGRGGLLSDKERCPPDPRDHRRRPC
jgi:hypothetical protein